MDIGRRCLEALGDILRLRAKMLGNKPFLISEAKTTSYAELDAAAAQLAHVLRAHGVRKGDPIGLFLPSCLQIF